MSKRVLSLVAAITVLLAFASCDVMYDMQLAGTWSRTYTILGSEYTDNITFANGDYVWVTVGTFTSTENGTYDASGEHLIFTSSGGSERTYSYTILGDQLTLSIPGGTNWVFAKQ